MHQAGHIGDFFIAFEACAFILVSCIIAYAYFRKPPK